MKKLGVIILTLSLFVGMFPQVAMAAQSADFEQQLTQYLSEVSTERGIEVTKADLEASLSTYELSLADFESIEEVNISFGEVIKADLSNLTSLYEDYELDEAALLQLLADSGEDLSDYIYLNDLDLAVYFYIKANDVFEREPDFDLKLVDYIAKVSTERGFEVTKEAIEASLSTYETTLEEFETVKELSDYLGEVIKPDLSNLSMYYESTELDEQSLLQLLEDNGKDINDYIYVFDLGEIVWSLEDDIPPFNEDMLNDLLALMGITDEEMQNIADYFMTLEDYFADPAVLERFEALEERLLAMDDTLLTEEITKEQLAEFTSIYEEALSILKLDVKFSILKDGSETPLSLMDLFNLKELDDSELKISIYGENSQFLADYLITSDFIDSIGGILEETEDIIESVDLTPVTKPDKHVSTAVKTVNGGKLPKTAANYIPYALIGLFIAFVGILMYRKVRNVKGEGTK